MPTVISLSGVEPVTTAEVKLAARIDTDALDTELAALITAAREQAEHITGRCYRRQVQRVELTAWPAATDELAVYAATACEVKYWNGTDFVLLDGSAYVFAPGGIGNYGTVLAPALGTSWPTLPERAAGPRVRIDLTAGPANAAEVPECVKLYVKASVAAWVKNPEALTGGAVQRNPLFDSLLDRERHWA